MTFIQNVKNTMAYLTESMTTRRTKTKICIHMCHIFVIELLLSFLVFRYFADDFGFNRLAQ